MCTWTLSPFLTYAEVGVRRCWFKMARASMFSVFPFFLPLLGSYTKHPLPDFLPVNVLVLA